MKLAILLLSALSLLSQTKDKYPRQLNEQTAASLASLTPANNSFAVQIDSLSATCSGAITGGGTTSCTVLYNGGWAYSGSSGTSALLSGTLAAIPATCTIGAAIYQATDQPISTQIYACTATNTWTRAAYTQGTTAPATCVVGRLFFDTDATAGSNLFGCTATDTWTLLGGGGSGATSASQLLDFQVVRTPTSDVLTIGANCSSTNPCNIAVGSTVYTFTAPATATITAGTGTAYIYVTSTGALTVGHNVTVTCSGCTSTGGVTAFPATSKPLWTWTATSTVWDALGGLDKRAFLSVDRPITPGAGISIATLPGGITIAATAIVASGTATLGTSAVAANTCDASPITVSATGTLTSSVIAAGFTADVSGVTGYGPLSTDGLYIIAYPSADNVNFKRCNGTALSITPGAATLNWRVL